MDKEIFDIGDNEIRVVGRTSSEGDKPKPKRRWWPWILLALLVIVVLYLFWAMSRPVYSPSRYSLEPVVDTTQQITYEVAAESNAYTIVSKDSINDVALQIYTPVGGHVELFVGRIPYDDKSIILATQAADYRADNGQISGAFVYKGELLSKGHPKYGFCAITGDKITMGMSQETVLFERAVEQEGYFFRQFSLVHDGKPGEKLPKGKAIRRALCYYNESIAIIESVDYESMHDFSQALIDLGVQEAISLVGSIELPLYENEDGKRVISKLEHKEDVQETYIVWRR